jgi:serine protease Do
MLRSARWPLLVVCLVGGVVAGRWSSQPEVQGQLAPAAVLPREFTSYRDVVKQVLPAVVSIESKAKPRRPDVAAPRRPRPRLDNQDIPEEFRRFFEQFEQFDRGQDALPPELNLGFGSGFIVDPSGVILTNYHVVDGADQVEVTLTDGRKFTSSDIKSDRFTDLAIVRIKSDAALPTLRFGDSSQMEIGDRVLAVGAPFGLTGSVTHGIISAKGRDLKLNRYDDFLQTDAAINPGNSGGPLINMAGEVIGVNSAIKSRTGGFQGVGMAIASNMARNIVNQLRTQGEVRRGYLGVEMALDVTPEVAERLGMKNGQGVVVSRVVENSPAEKAGLKPDDVILSLNGQSVRDNRNLVRVVGGLPIGQAVKVEVLRDGRPQTLSLTLEQQPANYGERRLPSLRVPRDAETVSVERAGLELTDLSADRAAAFGLKDGGALVLRVEPGSVAAEAGVARGLVIAKVDRKDVASAEAAKEALERSDPEKGALVHLRSVDGGTAIVLLKVPAK